MTFCNDISKESYTFSTNQRHKADRKSWKTKRLNEYAQTHTHTQSVLQFHDCQPRERDWDKKNEKEKIMHDHCNSTKL